MQTARQQQIVKSSMELIATKGIQGFTIKNLSKAIGISESGIYRHFENKTEISVSILNNFKEISEKMMAMVINNSNTTIERMEFMFSKMIKIFKEQPAFISIIFLEEIFKNEEIFINKIIKIQNIYQATIVKIIEIGQKEKSIRTNIDKNSLALIIMGSFRLLVKQWDLRNQQENLQTEGQKLINGLKIILQA